MTALMTANNKHFLQVSVFLQDFVNFTTFQRAKKRLKTSERIEQSRRR
jgi:hypothetical protein